MPATWDPASATDQQVVERARAGREDAYRELLRRYDRPVFSLIYRMVRDRELAEDLAQETFVKVLNALDTYRPDFKFSSWIFKIANNVAIDHLRRRQLDTLSLDPTHKHAFTRESFRRLLEAIDGWEIERLDICRPNWSFLCVARKKEVMM